MGSTKPYNSIPEKRKPHSHRDTPTARPVTPALPAPGRGSDIVPPMPITVILELRFKPDSVSAGRDLMRRTLEVTRGFDGNLRTDVLVNEDDEAHWIIYELWDTVEHDEAYRAFRAGEGKVTELPPLLAAPPVKTRYLATDI